MVKPIPRTARSDGSLATAAAVSNKFHPQAPTERSRIKAAMKNRPDMPAKTSEDRPPKPMIQGENSSVAPTHLREEKAGPLRENTKPQQACQTGKSTNLDKNIPDTLANASEEKTAKPMTPRENRLVTPTHLREEKPAKPGPSREKTKPQQTCQTGKSTTLDKNIPDTLANASEEKPAKPMTTRANRLVTPTHLREKKPAEAGPSRENTKPQHACPTGNSTTLDKNIPDTLANASEEKSAKPMTPRENRLVTPTHLREEKPTQAGPPREDRKTKRAPHCQTWEPMILDNRTSINPAPLSFQPAYLSGCAPAPSSPLHDDFTADPYFGNLNGRRQRNLLRDLRFIRDNYVEVSFQFM